MFFYRITKTEFKRRKLNTTKLLHKGICCQQ